MSNQLEKIYDKWFKKTGDARAAAAMASLEIQAAPKAETPEPQSNWLSIQQAAREFNVSKRALYRMRELHKRNGTAIRIKRSELAAHLEGEQRSLFG